MIMAGVVTIAVDKKGKTQVFAKGIQGQACSIHTKRFTDALGVVEEDEKTAEYYQNPPEKAYVNAGAPGQ